MAGLQDAIALAKLTVSYAVYMRLDHSGDVDCVSFTMDGPMKVKASLLVPKRPQFLTYYPVFAIVGSGRPRLGIVSLFDRRCFPVTNPCRAQAVFPSLDKEI